MRMRYVIDIYGLSVSAMFFHVVSQTAQFSGKEDIEHKMSVLIFCTNLVWNISHTKKNSESFIINVDRT